MYVRYYIMENQVKEHKRRVRYSGTHPKKYSEKYDVFLKKLEEKDGFSQKNRLFLFIWMFFNDKYVLKKVNNI